MIDFNEALSVWYLDRNYMYFEKIVLLWYSFLEVEYSFVVLGSLLATFILRILFIVLKDCIIKILETDR